MMSSAWGACRGACEIFFVKLGVTVDFFDSAERRAFLSFPLFTVNWDIEKIHICHLGYGEEPGEDGIEFRVFS